MWRILINSTYYAKHSNHANIKNPPNFHKSGGRLNT
nr:MAG TPA: hypothetical protein [Herelleviridae sp.]DAG95642.1 MAG TPA: hypothetical protein [Crassvirales sp.]DAK09618.1 MAG TPA: hypothetical protein [Caudoviricetes sp.]DAS27000.1 MAG TPA: hypothetical protein [Caudoviricetes sp.]